MGKFLGTVWLFMLMPIFIIANIIITQREAREEREKAEREAIEYTDGNLYLL